MFSVLFKTESHFVVQAEHEHLEATPPPQLPCHSLQNAGFKSLCSCTFSYVFPLLCDYLVLDNWLRMDLCTPVTVNPMGNRNLYVLKV